MTYFAPPTPYQSKARCTCGGWLYHSDRSNGYCYRVEFTDATGQPLTHCPGCGMALTGRWLQRCGEYHERQKSIITERRKECEAMEVTWICPKCNTENTDDYNLTAVPMCGGCDQEIDWDDIPEFVEATDMASLPSLEYRPALSERQINTIERENAQLYSRPDQW